MQPRNDSRESGNTEPDALVRRDVDLMKRAGAVFARLMHNPQAPNLLDYLDEKGMMIFAEIPVWGEGDPQVEADNPLARQWLREMIERDYNHPCIIGWSPGNELQRHHDYVRSMLAYIRKELDPHRLAAYISYSGAWDGVGPENDPITFGDIAMINVYNGNPVEFQRVAGILRERWPDKPVFFSEFGVAQIGADPAATIPRGDEIWAAISKPPCVIGGALWTFNDYRSDYKGTPVSGNREWGVVDEQRRPKAAYQQVRRWYCPVRSLELVGGAAVIQPRGSGEIPGYTLRGYSVRYVLRDRAGVEAGRGEIPVPVLKPGDPAWTAPIPGAREGLSVELSLFTPTGYDVCEVKTPLLKHQSPTSAQP
ncbi:MAG: glycoside hydrolase family 2 TIM barrel-domain containing protein [Kiritimatiellia bacterium]